MRRPVQLASLPGASSWTLVRLTCAVAVLECSRPEGCTCTAHTAVRLLCRPGRQQMHAKAVHCAVIERVHERAGIGFSKTVEGNCALVGGMAVVRASMQGTFRNLPILAGPSRKRFLGHLTGEGFALLPARAGSLHGAALTELH